jgi:hypothetical protein
MNQELDNRLCVKYPKIFADRHKDVKSTAMCWGFECGDGWYQLIDLLCGMIRRHQMYLDRNGKLEHQVVASQVKEKFGGLRFYVSGGDDVTYAYIDFAEQISFMICENCGFPGAPTSDRSWRKTLCPKCREIKS